MAGKSESSRAGKQSESAAKKPADKSQQGPAPDGTGYEAYLGAGEPTMDSLNTYLDGADEATRSRTLAEIQQNHGNDFVQRMLAQRQEHQANPSPDTVTGDPAEPGETSDEERQEQRENWQQWVQAAKSGVTTAVMMWANTARLVEVIINGPIALGGRISGSLPGAMVTGMVSSAGAPINVASAFGRATRSAWSGWARRVSVPGLPWYPAFASFPSTVAPPMPNVPTPLIVIAPGAFINAGDVSSTIMSGLGDNASDEGAQESIQEFAEWFSVSFTIWLVSSQVSMVIGKGPIPSFAPPYVPAGPVVGGSAESIGPFLAGSPSFGM